MTRRVGLKALADDLNAYFRGEKRGALNRALRLVAAQAQTNNILSFLAENNIHQRLTLDQDDNVLARLGFPDVIFKKSLLSNKLALDEEVCCRLIMAAATILLLSADESSGKPRPGSSSSRESPTPIVRDFTLALVLKGIDLDGIDLDKEVLLDDVARALEKATYFLCTHKKDMSTVSNKLSLDERTVDRESEQPVLVPINFRQSQELPANGFSNKLQVLQRLRQGATSFTVGTTCSLAKFGDLVKLGFVRS